MSKVRVGGVFLIASKANDRGVCVWQVTKPAFHNVSVDFILGITDDPQRHP